MGELAPCARCRRLHRTRDVACPFCSLARVVSVAALLPLAVACHSAETSTQGGAPSAAPSTLATGSASSAASVVPSVEPSSSAALTPSAVASAQQTLIGRDGGADAALVRAVADAGMIPGLGSTLLNSPGMGLYGAAPIPGNPSIGGAVPDVKATVSPSTPADARAITGITPRLRYCYQRARNTDPNMSGKLVMNVALDATGKATVTKKSGSGLSSETEQCMIAMTARASYEPAPSHDVEVTVTAKPPP